MSQGRGKTPELEALRRERCRLVMKDRWAKYHVDTESPEAREFRAKISARQLERHARYNVIKAMLDRMHGV